MSDAPGSKQLVMRPRLHLGTSSFSAKDWEGIFYPKGTAPGGYLAYYATRYTTVEVDATFYRIPSLAMTRKWRSVLPEGFKLAAKVPQVITHEKSLVECEVDLEAFLSAMEPLGDRLGPLLFQFPYFNKASPVTEKTFLQRLESFFPSLPSGYRYALEIRNRGWLKPALLDLLRQYRVALALIDHPWMPPVDQLLGQIDPVTSDFSYVRWLGDRRGIEKQTMTWNRLIVDRTREMEVWVPALQTLLNRGIDVYGYFNNHYGGYAPGSIELLGRAWDKKSPG